MSDVLPKIKLYLFISIIQLIVNFAVLIVTMASDSSINVNMLVLGSSEVGGAFVPFISLIPLAVIGFPVELTAIIGIVTGIFSVLQALIIFLLVLQMVSNLLWSPDV